MPAIKSDIGRYEDLVKDLLTEYKFLRDDIDDLYLACISTIMGKEYIRNTSLGKFNNDIASQLIDEFKDNYIINNN